MDRTNRPDGAKPSLLILCFSDLHRDVRILKQIRLFEDDYRVTTCGFGPAPSRKVRHIELTRGESDALIKARAVAIRLHLYSVAYWMTPVVRQAKTLLQGQHFDAVLADDLDTVGVAEAVVGNNRVHVDLHEYWPGIDDGRADWVRIRQPYNEWMLRTFVIPAASVTVVSEATAALYKERFGISATVVPNASPYHDLNVRPTGDQLRVVHTGAAHPERRIEDLMRAVARVPNASLDLYLVGEGTNYYEELDSLAGRLGSRICLREPIPSSAIVDTLNEYDVGIHQLPPVNTNHIVTMPNKFYEYVQARLALVVGRSGGMGALTNEYDVGVVAEGDSVEALSAALGSLTPQKVDYYKANSDRAAHPLAWENFEHRWQGAIGSIAGHKSE